MRVRPYVELETNIILQEAKKSLKTKEVKDLFNTINKHFKSKDPYPLNYSTYKEMYLASYPSIVFEDGIFNTVLLLKGYKSFFNKKTYRMCIKKA